jgi:L-fuculose-phosphate aldolase
MRLLEERAQLVRYAERLRPDGLVVGTSGNLSMRVGELVVATPSGVDYDLLSPELVCVCDLDGKPIEGELRPTTELPLHLAVYRSSEHQAIVHTHSTAATAVSTLVDELPPIHYLIALFGGSVRVAPYATYGSDELAASASEAMRDRSGCLLGNHGAVTAAGSLAKAFELSLYLEWLCDVWLRAASAGDPRLLPPEELARVGAKIASYGQVPPR